ncbi:MAG: arsenate reductase family protein [Oscillospiraceae bacterium]|nr:arsenate reductase family protein [Oscillospiraceae bacterium]
MVLFIEYPPCSTCKKAKAWLDANGIEYTSRHIKNDNPTADELAYWQTKSSKELKAFFNTSGILYREYELKDKLPTMSDDEKLLLLSSNGMLVKRPLIVTDNKVLVGFKEKEWEALFL